MYVQIMFKIFIVGAGVKKMRRGAVVSRIIASVILERLHVYQQYVCHRRRHINLLRCLLFPVGTCAGTKRELET